jgi:hypothetical protein
MLKFVFIIAFTEFRLFQSAKAKQIVENKKSLKDTCNLSLISFKKKKYSEWNNHAVTFTNQILISQQ